MRTRKSALKRFKLTKKGKLMHRGHGTRHLKSNKSKKQLRRKKRMTSVNSGFKKKIKQMIGAQ